MVPEKVLPYRLRGDHVIPSFLDAADLPWVELLEQEYRRFAGKPRRLLEEHFREPLPFDSPPYKRRLLLHALDKLWSTDIQAADSPAKVRESVFLRATSLDASRSVVIERVAAESKITAEEVEQALFADLRGERVMVPPQEELSPREIVLKTNLLLAQGLLCRSTAVRLWLVGNARRVVRHAKFKGLICTVSQSDAGEETRLDISGPLSLFRRTLMYGRALAQLVPYLSWCHRYRLESEVILQGENSLFDLRSGASVLPAAMPKRFDSKLEERFARDFGKLTTDWSIIREPDPIKASGTIIFPDFALIHRARPAEKWFLEILGFWTPDYLHRKLRQLRGAKLDQLILCIDETRQCGDAEIPKGAHVIPYRNRVDVQRVHALLTSV